MSIAKKTVWILSAISVIAGLSPIGSMSQNVICGDIDGDGNINLNDITHLIKYIYAGGEEPSSEAAADVNVDGRINLMDITYLIDYMYMNGPDLCPQSPWTEGQLILFDVWHVQTAQVEVMIGFYIDTMGQIIYYYGDPFWQPINPDSIAIYEFWDKYDAEASVIDTISIPFLRDQFVQVKLAKEGPFSETASVCSDTGIYYYTAYEYDENSQRYSPILLNQAGDLAQMNFHPSAEVLYDWLQTITAHFNNPPCQFIK